MWFDREKMQRISLLGDDHFLTPREVAEILGVRTTTVARWSREGRLPSVTTPGGHRRYKSSDVRALIEEIDPAEDETMSKMAEDAVRLYDQGWSIRQVAEKFDVDYSAMRRLLKRNGVQLRRQGKDNAARRWISGGLPDGENSCE